MIHTHLYDLRSDLFEVLIIDVASYLHILGEGDGSEAGGVDSGIQPSAQHRQVGQGGG